MARIPPKWTLALVSRLAPPLVVAVVTWAAPARAEIDPGGSPSQQAGAAPTATPPLAYPPQQKAWPTTTILPPPVLPAPASGQGVWSAAQPSELRPRSGGVYVELQADDPNTRIDRIVESTAVPVCLAPCRQILDRNSIYVIGGDGITSTSRFTLLDSADSLTLNIKAGSLSRSAGGGALLFVGGVLGLAGLLIEGLSSVAAASIENQGGNTNVARGNVVALGMMAIGLSAAAIGFCLKRTARTTVTSSTGATFSESPSGKRTRPLFALTPRGIEF